MIFRAHNGVRMEDKPCKLVAVEVRDAQSGKLTYKKPRLLTQTNNRLPSLHHHQQRSKRNGNQPPW